MHRSVLAERWEVAAQMGSGELGAGELGAGEVVVADGFVHPVRGPVATPAAPLVAGQLRRLGLTVRHAALPSPAQVVGIVGSTSAAALHAVSYLDGDGAAVGFGVQVGAGQAATEAAVRGVLAEWSDVLRTRRLLVAAADPACAGARRALDTVREALEVEDEPAYVYGRLSENPHVVAELTARGAVFVDDLDMVPDSAPVVLPPHGAVLAVRAEAARGLRVLDATCPLLSTVAGEARRLAERGDTLVLIGRAGHAVTPGLLDQAPAAVLLVQSAREAAEIRVADPDRVSFLPAPGIPVEDTAPIVAALRNRFPRIVPHRPTALCYAATDRREAVRSMAAASEVVLVATVAMARTA
jgi:4-hydroxy-3-methylbut-2-en-1-yl diphosphate reductase